MKHKALPPLQRLALFLAAVMLMLPMLAPLGQAEAAPWSRTLASDDTFTTQRVSWSSGPQ